MRLAFPIILLLTVTGAPELMARDNSRTARDLTVMLRQFLDDAAKGNREGFEKFFADDVIYTRSAGVVIGKADIMNGIERLKPTAEKKTTYSAEDITIHEYGDTAIVAFRLVARTEHQDGRVETERYRNTGTFLRRRGRWQAAAWQATMVPPAGTESGH